MENKAVIINKFDSIQRCINRIKEEYDMKGMIGFRNIAIHDYKQIDKDILQDVIENHLIDLTEFAKHMLNI